MAAWMPLPKWALQRRSSSGRFKGAAEGGACNGRLRGAPGGRFKGALQVGTSKGLFNWALQRRSSSGRLQWALERRSPSGTSKALFKWALQRRSSSGRLQFKWAIERRSPDGRLTCVAQVGAGNGRLYSVAEMSARMGTCVALTLGHHLGVGVSPWYTASSKDSSPTPASPSQTLKQMPRHRDTRHEKCIWPGLESYFVVKFLIAKRKIYAHKGHCFMKPTENTKQSKETPTSTPFISLSSSINHMSTTGPQPTASPRATASLRVCRCKWILPLHPSNVSTIAPPSRYTLEQTLSIGGYARVILLTPFIFLGTGTFSGTKGYLVLPPTLGTQHATLTLFFSLTLSVGGYPRVILGPPVLPLGVGDEEGPSFGAGTIIRREVTPRGGPESQYAL